VGPRRLSDVGVRPLNFTVRDNIFMDYPNDADGDSLRRVRDGGSDMSLPMTIDFSIDVPNESAARAVAALVSTHGFDPSISDNEGRGWWSVYCSKTMLATYDSVVSVQGQLNELAKPQGGICDGWETFGNSQSRP
jgi:Regulator of ribonuclease activity B